MYVDINLNKSHEIENTTDVKAYSTERTLTFVVTYDLLHSSFIPRKETYQ